MRALSAGQVFAPLLLFGNGYKPLDILETLVIVDLLHSCGLIAPAWSSEASHSHYLLTARAIALTKRECCGMKQAGLRFVPLVNHRGTTAS